MTSEAEEQKLQQMAKVHDFLEMWQGSQNLKATQKESCTQNKQMTAVGYILDTEEIVKESLSNFQHDGAAVFKLFKKSPVPPALSAKNHPEGQTQVRNVRWIKAINHHPAESDEHSSPETISDTKNWPNWNGNLDNPNNSKDDWKAANESYMELDNTSEDSETPEQRNVSTAPNVPGLIRPIQRLKKMVGKALMTVNIMEMTRNTGLKKK